jgi:hypothetical protein
MVHLLSKVDFDIKEDVAVLSLELKSNVGIPRNNIRREEGED